MRKALRLKAITLLLSWTIIFLHGLVPHLHADHPNHDHNSNECRHSTDSNHMNADEKDNSPWLMASDSHDHNESVCHFNPNLFSQLNLDVSFVQAEDFEAIEIREKVVFTRPDTEPKIKKPPLLSTSALRAPPSV